MQGSVAEWCEQQLTKLACPQPIRFGIAVAITISNITVNERCFSSIANSLNELSLIQCFLEPNIDDVGLHNKCACIVLSTRLNTYLDASAEASLPGGEELRGHPGRRGNPGNRGIRVYLQLLDTPRR